MNFINYDKQMRTKYINKTINSTLNITNDEQLIDIQFTKQLNTQQLTVNNCKNIQLLRTCKTIKTDENGFVQNNLDVQIIQAPVNLTVLKINNCQLTHLTGIQHLRNLQEIDLRNNKIVSIQELKQLQVQKVELEHNIIFDMNVLTELKNYNTDMVQEQDEGTDQDYTKYLEQTSQKIELDKFKESIAEQKKITQELILKFGRRYEKDMIAKYQKDVNNNSLVVSNDEQIINLNFADDLNVSSLTINNCKNVKFVKVPVKVTSLAVNDCNITNVNGIEAMNQLQIIELANYPLTTIQPVYSMTNVISIKINNTKITNIAGIETLNQLKTIELTNNPITSIKSVYSLINITSLKINNTYVTNIIGIEAMTQLTNVDLRSNAIIFIEPLKRLTNLKQVRIDNNFVQDLEYLANQDWVSEQRVPTDANLQQYLTDTNSSLSLDAFKAQIAPKLTKSDQLLAPLLKYDSELSNKFKSQVNYNKLEIISDTSVKEIKFMDQISVECLIINKCTNFSFRRAPTQLLYLTLNDCNITDLEGLQQFKQLKKFESNKNTQLTSIKQVYSLTNLLSLTINNTKINNLVGIEQLSKLQYIDLRDNCIVSIEPVKQLQYLKQVLIDNNFIQDLEHLTATKNYNPEWIYYQNAVTDSELARYLTDTQLKITLLELKTGFEGKKRRTDELIRDHPAAYDAKMKAKYQNSVNRDSGNSYGPYLRIENDPEIRDLRFVSELGVTNLQLRPCENAHLLRAPANLRLLAHYPSGMKTAKGLERLVELEYLDIEDAQIVELNIRGLEKLTQYLHVRRNKIRDVSAVEYLKAKGYCQSNYYVDQQKQPSQEEIDEARLW
ncbi:leucine-rich_repeat domain-containing protein [Hexamita inflata]|uniref:Leucine-rich_repeat domain-containing protein n=1 Tax=Hexamita inflata TaxID=28002 RepID=A0ABP1HRH1_9EUKA